MNRRHIVMGVAVLGAAALAFFGDKTPDSGVAEAVERSNAAPATPLVLAPSAAPRTTGSAGAQAAILALVPRATLIGESDEAMGRAADVFGRQDWTPPPQPPPPQSQTAAAPPPPMAPPLPFTYLGKAAENGRWEVFLAVGDKTYVVHDKMVIDGMYRVEQIAPPNLTLTYLPLNQVQQLNIGVLD